MGAKPKSGKVRGAAGKPAARPACRRRAAQARDGWEQTAQVPEQRDDDVDCQRIVPGGCGRGLPLYCDDYN